MVALLFDESGRVGAIVLAILIAAIAYAGFSVGIILTEKTAAEETVTERTVAEKTVTVTLVVETKVETKMWQKKEVTWLDAFITIFGVSLIIALAIAYFYMATRF